MSSNNHPRTRHHNSDGTYANPWAEHRPSARDLFRFARSMRRMSEPLTQGRFPILRPHFGQPRARKDEVSVTWIGHSTTLIQIAGANILTDPIWSERASPVRFAGPRRFMPPPIRIEDLPPIDAVLLSHDHYDHTDTPTLRALHHRTPTTAWYVPPGMSSLLRRHGISRSHELDWWNTHDSGELAVTAVPAQHFSGRMFRRNRSLWCGFVLSGPNRNVYFVGDTGWFPEFEVTAQRCGPFDIVLMPVGAYDPRWLMQTVHLSPEEAVQAYVTLTQGNAVDRPCTMVPVHWGTFKLTLEPLAEPPVRVRRAWQSAGLMPDLLRVLAHGETMWLTTRSPTQHD